MCQAFCSNDRKQNIELFRNASKHKSLQQIILYVHIKRNMAVEKNSYILEKIMTNSCPMHGQQQALRI
ncbi:MAG: hypothetical protein C0403_16345 [Desulfobacterium sp.]|nr:hypothetical protein [Desulfobacterium sp.]